MLLQAYGIPNFKQYEQYGFALRYNTPRKSGIGFWIQWICYDAHPNNKWQKDGQYPNGVPAWKIDKGAIIKGTVGGKRSIQSQAIKGELTDTKGNKINVTTQDDNVALMQRKSGAQNGQFHLFAYLEELVHLNPASQAKQKCPTRNASALKWQTQNCRAIGPTWVYRAFHPPYRPWTLCTPSCTEKTSTIARGMKPKRDTYPTSNWRMN